MPQFGGGNSCQRCKKTVYHAEQVTAANHFWHPACFCCAECKAKLEKGSLQEHKQEIYCKACYGRNFGPRGYGYGQGSGTLSMDGTAGSKAASKPHIEEAMSGPQDAQDPQED